jgi:septal ring factor EnvC (AmiA/AmiB activator)
VESLITLISELVKDGIVADTTLLLVIISLLGVLYKFFLVPMFDKLSSVPSLDSLKQIIKESDGKSELELKEVSNKLDKLIEALDEIESTGNSNRRDIKDLRRDVEQIKQILNQFQGHFMYSGGPSHFGNRELK